MPLIAAGAATAGLVGGLAVLNRGRGGPGLISRMRSNSNGNGSLDLDALISGAQRLGGLGDQIGELAGALQRLNEGSKK
jgi:hypothetical protein